MLSIYGSGMHANKAVFACVREYWHARQCRVKIYRIQDSPRDFSAMTSINQLNKTLQKSNMEYECYKMPYHGLASSTWWAASRTTLTQCRRSPPQPLQTLAAGCAASKTAKREANNLYTYTAVPNEAWNSQWWWKYQCDTTPIASWALKELALPESMQR